MAAESAHDAQPEYETIRKNLVAICNCISESDIVKFAIELFQSGLIGDAGYKAAISAGTGTLPANKVAHLVTETMYRVKSVDSLKNFRKLLSILNNRDKRLVSILCSELAAQETPPQETLVLSGYRTVPVKRSHHEPDGPLSSADSKRSKQVHTTEIESSFFSLRLHDVAKNKTEPRLRLIGCCKIMNSPVVYQLPLRYEMKRDMVAKAVVGEDISRTSRAKWSATMTGIPHKVLMVVGGTGEGKTTLINAMANYIMGVDWEDEYRFKLIHEETAYDQTKSQTKCITAYTFYKDEHSSLPYTLTVIDTPGLGGTEGLERDKEIVAQIKEFFSIRGDQGIDLLHGVGFVASSSQSRLTPTQRYVFDAILSVFGKDVADNIFLMVTSADGKRPPVLDAIRAAKISFNGFFKFNNSAVFATNQDDDCFSEMFWKMCTINFVQFFVEFSRAESKSLQQSREVLEERERLELTIHALQPRIRARLNKMAELQQERQLLKDYEFEIITSKDFPGKLLIQVSKQRMVSIPQEEYTTNCLKCKHTCHYPCPYSSNDDKYKCRAMNNCGSQDATCSVCPGKCSWRDHVNNPYKYEMYQQSETRTSDELKAMYESALSNKKQVETVMKKIEDELNKINAEILQEIGQARRSLQRLREIALKPNHLTDVEYIDELIDFEKHKTDAGWSQRVKVLEEVRQQAQIISIIAKQKEANLHSFDYSSST